MALSYLYVPAQISAPITSTIMVGEDSYTFWTVDPIDVDTNGYYKVPLGYQESVSVDKLYNYSDISVTLTVEKLLFRFLYHGYNKLIVLVDNDNIVRTPMVTSSNRLLNTNLFKVNLSLKPFNCYRVYSDGRPVSDLVSYKVNNSILNDFSGSLMFDPPYSLLLSQTEEVI